MQSSNHGLLMSHHLLLPVLLQLHWVTKEPECADRCNCFQQCSSKAGNCRMDLRLKVQRLMAWNVITIGTADLTAGRFKLYVEYVEVTL